LASADNSVTVWRERNMLRVYTGQHDPWVESVAWGPDHIAAGLNNGTLIWYDGETGQLVHREAHAHQAGIEGVAFSREGHLASVSGLANGSDYALVIWRGMQRHLTLQGLYAAAWSPAGGQIAAGLGQQLVLYDAATGQPQHAYTAHADAIRDVTWQNGTLASAGQDATAVIWDEVGGHAMLHTLDARAQAATSASVADNGFLAVGHRGGVTIWRGQWPYTVRVGRDVWVTDVAYYGDLLAAATDDGRVLLVRGLTIHETLHGHAAGINALAWSPHGDRLASASADGTVILWEVTP
ncbi:MAG: hypothetical protein GYB64_05300, partial [Chloroflexi bacterium]|nr:hypothetical protein [Chloroflexota bacterium]